jgi:hypothetical protein
MGSLREKDQEQDQKPRSRSRAGSLQKNFVFSQWLFVSKAGVAPALFTRTAPVTVPITPMNISLQGMYGCAVSPRKAKAG